MRILGLIDEDFTNYRKPSMFICTIKCNWKCGKEVCQNRKLENEPIIDYPNSKLVARYLANPLTHAIVFGGLEPLDQIEELIELIGEFRAATDDDIVIYTGYNFDEIYEEFERLLLYPNIFLKVGRYLPDDTAVYEPLLGVTLSSSNQYVVTTNAN